MSKIDKLIKEMEKEVHDICDYCYLDKKGVEGGPNGPIYYCNDEGCNTAYDNYLEEREENDNG